MGFRDRENRSKYPGPPTWSQIIKVLLEYEVDEDYFEKYHGLYRDCINKVMRNVRPFPSKCWHVIYEPLEAINQGLPLPVYPPHGPIKHKKRGPIKSTKRNLQRPQLINDLL